MRILYNTIFGSRLYGTNIETSDFDFRGVFMPSSQDILLGTIPRTMTLKPEHELFSLHYFLKLALDGQTVALDILFSAQESLSQEWNFILQNREKLLSKNINAFIGYARTQANKYSLKGERLNKLLQLQGILKKHHNDDCLHNIEDLKCIADDSRINANNIEEVQFAGKWFGQTTQIKYILPVVNKQINRYGNRAAIAYNEQKDWKALSHAVRVAYESILILGHNKITFPLLIKDELIDIRLGKIAFDRVQERLGELISTAEVLRRVSTLPEKPNSNFWNNFIMEAAREEITR